MSRIHGFATFVGVVFFFLFLVACVVPGFAQVPLPDACSARDQELSMTYSQRATDALLEGHAARFVQVLHELEAKMSPACRAAMARLQPASSKCSTKEKQTVLSGFSAIMESAMSGDQEEMFQQFADLESSISRPCWIAVNRHQEPRVVKACTEDELDLMASYSGPLTRALRPIFETGDIAPMLQIVMEITGHLSPACNAALAELQSRQQRPGESPTMRLPNVLDHGGGTYSVPGLGACSHSGCVAY